MQTSDELIDQIPVSESELRDLVDKIRKFEETLSENQRKVLDPTNAFDPATGSSKNVLSNSNISPDELQKFLEEKAGVVGAEQGQGSVFAAAVSVAAHC